MYDRRARVLAKRHQVREAMVDYGASLALDDEREQRETQRELQKQLAGAVGLAL